MRCPACQHENSEAAKFCEECGQRLRLRCPSCGFEVAPSAKFCPECGQRLGSSTTSIDIKAQFGSSQAYTPKHLAEKILTSRSALEGERKQVTVLFADLKGSMELLADRDPEEARKLLDPVLERMMEAVHHYEGTVNQVMGDGIMALFGAPIAHEDHAVRACYAALRMQETVRRYGDEVQRSHGVPVQIRVGLNSGEVVVRSIGSDLHMDYTAVGQTTHLAARMEQMARPGSILITPEVLRFAEGYVQLKPLGPVAVKGLSTPVDVYEVTGAGSVRTRLQVAATRGLTRFVGRDVELDQLRQAIERAGAGRGQVLALVGEAGVGKSRLIYEFIHSHRTRGWLLLESSSVSYGKATPYLPLIDLLKAYFQVEDRDERRKVREKVAGKLVTLDTALSPTLPVFLTLLHVPADDPQWEALDPPERRQRTLDACKHLLLRESQVQPLLVVFEDLHWIDAETQTFLDSLVESLPAARILLLVNYRPEYQHGWGRKTYYTQLRLDPLPQESAVELLESLLGDSADLAPLKQLLIERTEGNPFFLEESVRTLVETQVLVGERRAYRLAKPLASLQVPATAQGILAARIDRLPPEEKRLLQTAAVIGTDVPFPLLQAIAELPEEALRRGLSYLQAGEFLYETRLYPELEYTFKHALTHQVAYGNLLQERRRRLHAKIAESIEARHPDRLAEQVEQLVHHALRGEVWGKAVTYLRQASAKASARGAIREAVVYLEQALGALQHLPESRDTLAQALDLRLDLHFAFIPLGELGPMLDHLRTAEGLAEALHDQRRLGQVYRHMIHYFWVMGDHDRAVESGQRALAIAAALGDVALQADTNLPLGLAYRTLGDYRRAMECFRRYVASRQGNQIREYFGARAPRVDSLSYLVWCLAELGEFAEAISRGEEAVRLAEALGQPEGLIFADRGVGYLYLVKGDLHKAIPALEHVLALARDRPGYLPWITASLGYAYALAGRITEAIPLLEEAVQRAASTGRVGQSLRLAYLSEAYLLAGQMESVLEPARRALALSREHKERGHEAYALRLLGEIGSRRHPPEAEQAEAAYRQAIALADELGMRPLLARCHLGLGALYRQLGWLKRARSELCAARELFRAMEMSFWLTQVEAALAQAE